MPHLTLRVSADLLAWLDEFRTSRGLKTRADAVRLAIREASMEPEERDTVPDRDELLRLLGGSARDGSVTAMKALLEEHRHDGNDDPKPERSAIDELAHRRANRVG